MSRLRNLLISIALSVGANAALAQDSNLLDPGVQVTATVAFGSITGSYATALTDTHRKRLCVFTNSTDKTIAWDDGTTAIIAEQLSNTTVILDWATHGRYIPTSLRVKYTNGAPGSGNADVTCQY